MSTPLELQVCGVEMQTCLPTCKCKFTFLINVGGNDKAGYLTKRVPLAVGIDNEKILFNGLADYSLHLSSLHACSFHLMKPTGGMASAAQ